MVRRALRSRSYRKVKVKIPSSKVVVHYRKKKPKLGRCAVTGEKLKGVPRARPREMQNMAKSKKRPNRPYGGVLSSHAMRKVMKQKAKSLR